MGILFAYILKSALFVIAYYLFYRLLLSRDTFHRFNRWALLSILMLSIVLPFIQFSINELPDAAASTVGVEMPTMTAVLDDAGDHTLFPTVLSWMMLVYLAGVLFFLIKAVTSYASLYRLLTRFRHTRLSRYGIEGHDDKCLIVHNEEMAPFSWMHYIVINERDMQANGPAIVAHELGHIAHHHTLDLLFTEVCVILQWFNPAIWLMRRELQTIHEYQADEAVLQEGFDARQYQLLLIEKATGARLQSITCSLHQSSIKKRITMMLKKKSNPWAKAKMLFAVPVAVAGIAAFSTPEASALTTEVSSCTVSEVFADAPSASAPSAPDERGALTIVVKNDGQLVVNDTPMTLEEMSAYISDWKSKCSGAISVNVFSDSRMSNLPAIRDVLRKNGILQVTYSIPEELNKNKSVQLAKTENLEPVQKKTESAGNEVFTMCEQPPVFPGGDVALMQYIRDNLKYPEECAKEGVQGRVVLSFVVEKDGSISTIEPMRSPDPHLTEEAIRVIKSMPKWEPGKQRGHLVRVQYVLPVTFRLQ